MSTERGNAARTRSQKHQNKTKFKNNLHDTSHTTKFINNLEVSDVCARCKSIIEWKIKYKKYKPLKSPSTCVKCHQKSIKHAYHTLCAPCAKKYEVCPKCATDFLKTEPSTLTEEELLKNPKIQQLVKTLPERKRRTFSRFLKNIQDVSEEKVFEKLKELTISENKSEQFEELTDDEDKDDDDPDDL